jgi:hypothetical protein
MKWTCPVRFREKNHLFFARIMVPFQHKRLQTEHIDYFARADFAFHKKKKYGARILLSGFYNCCRQLVLREKEEAEIKGLGRWILYQALEYMVLNKLADPEDKVALFPDGRFSQLILLDDGDVTLMTPNAKGLRKFYRTLGFSDGPDGSMIATVKVLLANLKPFRNRYPLRSKGSL